MSGLLELALRCEKATGPDRELDCLIALHTGIGGHRKDMLAAYGDQALSKLIPAMNYFGTCDECGSEYGRVVIVPDFTASIDAAMTLVPEGAEWECGMAHLINAAWASVITVDQKTKGKSRTTALALSAAALRARSALSASAEQDTLQPDPVEQGQAQGPVGHYTGRPIT